MKAEEFGNYLRNLRKSKNMTIRQLELYSGVSNAYLSQLENGKRGIPSPEILKKLHTHLDVSYEELMKEAGHLPSDLDNAIPNDLSFSPSTRDFKDLNKMLDQSGIMFDGVPLTNSDKQRIKDILTGMFWEAKEMNKRKKKQNKD